MTGPGWARARAGPGGPDGHLWRGKALLPSECRAAVLMACAAAVLMASTPVRSVSFSLQILSFTRIVLSTFHLGVIIKEKDFAYHLINYNSSISMLSIHAPIFFLEKLLCTEI